MNASTEEKDVFLTQLRGLQQSIIATAENFGMGDAMRTEIEKDEAEIKKQFEPLSGMLRKAYEQSQDPEYRKLHKRDRIERFFPDILTNHITKLMTIVNRQDVLRVDRLLESLKQRGVEAVWPEIEVDFTSEIKRVCGEVFSDEDVKFGALEVKLEMQEIQKYVSLQKLSLRQEAQDSVSFSGFRRGFLNTPRQNASSRKEPSDSNDFSPTK
jgi:hypothetical protein